MSTDYKKVNEEIVKDAWTHNAREWIRLSETGKDFYRDLVNTPGFLKILPNIKNLRGLDIGCGTGHNTRLLSKRGANMSGIDIIDELILFAQSKSEETNTPIEFQVGDASKLPYEENSFDFATAFVSLIDMPKYEEAIKEAYRVLKQGGFFQFSVTHPCFWKPNMEWKLDQNGNPEGLVTKDYFSAHDELLEWMFDGVDCHEFKFKTAHFHRTLEDWVNTTIKAGFTIEVVHEPKPSKEDVAKEPSIKGSEIVPYFLIIRAKKNSNT